MSTAVISTAMMSIETPEASRADERHGRDPIRLVVSCQAAPGHPLRQSPVIAALARCAELGGAAGVRVDGAADVAAVRAATSVPIIGIAKDFGPGRRPYITTSFDACAELARAGADIVAVEATDESPRVDGFAALVERVHRELDLPVMADVATFEEGMRAHEAGADLVGTTLSGYTRRSAGGPTPDLELVGQLAAGGIAAVLEGHVSVPAQLSAAIQAGAWAVVVGTAITDPLALTKTFVQALRSNR